MTISSLNQAKKTLKWMSKTFILHSIEQTTTARNQEHSKSFILQNTNHQSDIPWSTSQIREKSLWRSTSIHQINPPRTTTRLNHKTKGLFKGRLHNSKDKHKITCKPFIFRYAHRSINPKRIKKFHICWRMTFPKWLKNPTKSLIQGRLIRLIWSKKTWNIEMPETELKLWRRQWSRSISLLNMSPKMRIRLCRVKKAND